MNKISRISLSILAAVTVFSASPAAFAEATSTSPSNPKATAKKEEVKTTVTERLATNKEKFAANLNDAAKTKLKTVCKGGQVKVKALDAKVTASAKARTNVYKGVSTKLSKLIPRIKDAGISTTQLESDKEQLDTLIAAYQTSLAAYQTSLGDLAELDCQTDPEAFKSTLEATRTAQAKVLTDAKAVRNQISVNIKNSLALARSEIAVKNSKKTDSDADKDGETPATPTTSTTPTEGEAQ